MTEKQKYVVLHHQILELLWQQHNLACPALMQWNETLGTRWGRDMGAKGELR